MTGGFCHSPDEIPWIDELLGSLESGSWNITSFHRLNLSPLFVSRLFLQPEPISPRFRSDVDERLSFLEARTCTPLARLSHCSTQGIKCVSDDTRIPWNCTCQRPLPIVTPIYRRIILLFYRGFRIEICQRFAGSLTKVRRGRRVVEIPPLLVDY